MISEHCVRHCTLIMMCGIVLGKAKMTKAGMVWYELNIVNESINDRGRYIAARAAKNILGKCRLRKYTVEIQFGNIQFGNKNFIYTYF